MKKVFYLGLVLLVLFEIANVYFIMPMPFSQRMRSIDLAYFLYSSRWVVRAVLGALILAGAPAAFRAARAGWKAVPAISVLVTAVIAYGVNFKMSADRIFLEPASVVMKTRDANVVDSARLVVGVDINGDARAYPLQFIGYHHQVRDVAGGTPVMVSYCTVCRTGRVFSPIVDGKLEAFRLVGMDHFNAMFEDKRTGSWWRQATGEAMVGPMKGKVLKELASEQMTLAQWLTIHPRSVIMQPDSTMLSRYPKSFAYETGESRSALTGTDTISWRDKAWVVGVTVAGVSKAYDWNRLKRERVVNDVVGGKPIVLVMARDNASFFAYERPDTSSRLQLRGDSLVGSTRTYAIAGAGSLPRLSASQEFWHSWRTFHPGTATY